MLQIFIRLIDAPLQFLILVDESIDVSFVFSRLRVDKLLRHIVEFPALFLVPWIRLQLLSFMASYWLFIPRTMLVLLPLQYIYFSNSMPNFLVY